MLAPPMSSLPFEDPLGHPLEHVLRVTGDLHLARLFERQQALNRSHQFHAVIGRMRVESEELPFYATEPKQAGPAPWPGIAEARAVGNKGDFLHAPGLAMAAPEHFLYFLPLRQGQ